MNISSIKKEVFFLIFALIVIFCNSRAFAADYRGVVNQGVYCLNVRTGPGVENSVVSQIHEGTAFDVTGQSSGWYAVKFDDDTQGWVYGKYITVTEKRASLKLISPEMNANLKKGPIIFKWSFPEDAEYFRLIIRDQTDKSKKYEYMPRNTEYKLLAGLEDGHAYKWSVAPVVNNEPGEYSKIFDFTIGQAQLGPAPEIKGVYVVSSQVGSSSETIPTASSKVVPHNADVRLYAVIRADIEGRAYYFLGDESKESRGFPVQAIIYDRTLKSIKKVDLARWKKAWGELDFKWGNISARLYHKNLPHYNGEDSPDYVWYTNVVPNGPNEARWWKWDRLEYAENQITPKKKWWQFILPFLKNNYSWSASVPVPENGGTNRFKILVQHKQGSQVLGHFESYGRFEDPFNSSATLKDEDYNFGIKEDVHRVTFLGNNENRFLQALLGYKGIPWIYGSASHSSIGHQTSAFLGFDCADLAMGAWKLGMDNNFTVTSGAHNLCNRITSPMQFSSLEFARYGDSNGRGGTVRQETIFDAANIPVIIPVGQGNDKITPGDVVFFDWNKDNKWDHTTVFYKEGPKNKGFLSSDDYFIWANHDGLAVKTFLTLLHHSRTRFIIRKWTK